MREKRKTSSRCIYPTHSNFRNFAIHKRLLVSETALYNSENKISSCEGTHTYKEARSHWNGNYARWQRACRLKLIDLFNLPAGAGVEIDGVLERALSAVEEDCHLRRNS